MIIRSRGIVSAISDAHLQRAQAGSGKPFNLCRERLWAASLLLLAERSSSIFVLKNLLGLRGCMNSCMFILHSGEMAEWSNALVC
ncbi:MAG TPA: hypothetical protein DCY32_05465 [Opitutae bacterium]|nr:hypothetical protein [Opitutae bacterium]